jgi:hypothetical protein
VLVVQDGPLASLFAVSWSHTYRHTVGLLWTSDQPIAEASTYTGQQYINKKTNIHAPSGIRTRDPNNQAAADLWLRRLGHCDRLIVTYLYEIHILILKSVVFEMMFVSCCGVSNVHVQNASFVSCGVVYWPFNGDRHAQICVLSVCTVTHTFPVFCLETCPLYAPCIVNEGLICPWDVALTHFSGRRKMSWCLLWNICFKEFWSLKLLDGLRWHGIEAVRRLRRVVSLELTDVSEVRATSDAGSIPEGCRLHTCRRENLKPQFGEFNFVLRFSQLEFNLQLRSSGVSRVECWELLQLPSSGCPCDIHITCSPWRWKRQCLPKC